MITGEIIIDFLEENRKKVRNNKVVLVGKLEKNFELDHSTKKGANFYISYICSKRRSNTYDVLPIVIPEKLLKEAKEYVGKIIKVEGKFESFNKVEDDGKRHLKLFVEVEKIKATKEKDFNLICLDGFIVKEPVFRTTPLGREITDIMIAVDRKKFNISDYIPCIAWNKNANIIKDYKVGDRIRFFGRIQSREYFKKDSADSDSGEYKVAYEISMNNFI